MGIRLINNAKQILKQRRSSDHYKPPVPKGHIAVRVGEAGETSKRFVVPITYLNHPLFADMLKKAEEEFGFSHPMGALTIPCNEDYFTSRLHCIIHGS